MYLTIIAVLSINSVNFCRVLSLHLLRILYKYQKILLCLFSQFTPFVPKFSVFCSFFDCFVAMVFTNEHFEATVRILFSSLEWHVSFEKVPIGELLKKWEYLTGTKFPGQKEVFLPSWRYSTILMELLFMVFFSLNLLILDWPLEKQLYFKRSNHGNPYLILLF